MRRTIAAVVAALLGIMVAAALAGCSSDSSTAAAPTASAAPAPVAASLSTTAPVEIAAKPLTDTHPFPTLTTATAPPAVQAALGTRPMLLVFFDSKQAVTRDLRTVLSALGKKFAGKIDIDAFDLAVVRKAAPGSKTYKAGVAAVGLAQKLDIGYMPAMVVVSADKQITWQSTGYYDAGTLEREIMRVAQ